MRAYTTAHHTHYAQKGKKKQPNRKYTMPVKYREKYTWTERKRAAHEFEQDASKRNIIKLNENEPTTHRSWINCADT